LKRGISAAMPPTTAGGNSKADVIGGRQLRFGLALVITLVASFQVVSTYKVFTQVSDESAHIACGMEWLEKGTYTYEELHPPVARVAAALGPYLSGLRLSGHYPKPMQMWAEGNEILWTNGEYTRNLTLARLGVLPFFVILLLTVWNWTRSLYGQDAAVVALLLFASLPPVLGNAGLAMTDVPFTAMFTLALFAFMQWLEEPSGRHAIALGLAVALAVGTKFSALLFLPTCMLTLVTVWVWADTAVVRGWRKALRSLGLAAVTTAGLLWGVYRFSLRPMSTHADRPHETIERFLGNTPRLHGLAETLVESVPVPAPELFLGINRVRHVVTTDRKSYLLGRVSTGGNWYFFPLALAVKTPLAFLIFSAVGAWALARKWKVNWQTLLPATAAVTILLVSLTMKLNIGLRHILVIYPFLAMHAALGLLWLWESRRATKALALGLVSWQLISVARTHPDYLASFNEIASGHPEEILVDTDLDFGQDMGRLVAKLKELNVKELSISCNGSIDLSRLGLPPFQRLVPYEHTTGWVAISMLKLKTGGLESPADAFAWLEAYQPVALVGKSIRVYYVPAIGHSGP
jgi:hypothetical protein